MSQPPDCPVSGTSFKWGKKDMERGSLGGRGGLGVWHWCMRTEVHGMTGQQGPAVQHREPYPIFYDGLYGKRI